MNKYFDQIAKAVTINEINDIVEKAAFDESLTNEEYTEIYAKALRKAQEDK